jgi:tetratricopeptide (TPR) repeat protein
LEAYLPVHGLSQKVGRLQLTLLAMLLAAVTVTVYWQVGTHAFLDYDDGRYITENPHVTSGLTETNIRWAFTAVHASNWHPITWLSHMADVQLYGLNPQGHHLTNVGIHSLSTMLLLVLLFRLTGLIWQSGFVAALFALHPLHVESVAWAAERKDVLSAFFLFLTLIFYVSHVKKRSVLHYMLALVSFLLGLMAKPMLVTLPLVMLLLDYWPLNRFLGNEHDTRPIPAPGIGARMTALVREKVPFIAGSVISSLVTIYAQHHGGALKSLLAIPFRPRVANACVAYATYLAKTLWPVNLAVFYPLPAVTPLWHVFASLFLLLLLSGTTLAAGKRHPYLPVGWFWFILTLVPVIGLVQVGDQSLADRYTYIPLIGLFIMAAWGIPELSRNLPYRKELNALMATVTLAFMTALTWQQIGHWQNSITLFSHAARTVPGNYLARFNLGSLYEKQGDFTAATWEYREALAIQPYDIKTLTNLGSALARSREFDAAIDVFRQALALNPDDVMVLTNLGNALAEKGDLGAAVKAYEEAINRDPAYVAAHFNLALAREKQQQHTKAGRE